MELLITHERIDDILKIEKMLKDSNLLLHPNDMEMKPTALGLFYYHLYDETNYNKDFVCHLDRNIVSYLISLCQEDPSPSKESTRIRRLTAALQFFKTEAKIKSDVTVSYHEFIDSFGIETSNKELNLFQSIDNISSNIYLDIALGEITHIPTSEIREPKNPILIKENPGIIDYFKHNVTYIKKSILIRKRSKSDYEALLSLVDWAFDDYIFTLPAFHFLSIYFSSEKISKMLKSTEEKGIRNAAWDLCLIQQLLYDVKNNSDIWWSLSTFDKAVQETAFLVFGKRDQNLDNYFADLEKKYKKMWGRNNNHGKKLLKKLNLLNEIVEKRSKSIDNELIYRTSNIVADEFNSHLR